MRPLTCFCILLAVFMTVAAHANETYFDFNGVKIRYVCEGAGEAVVLIHGILSNVEDAWGPQGEGDPGMISGLAKTFKVVAYDLRGQGKSDKPHDPKLYGNEMVRDVIRLLDHLHIKKAHVIGYSMGGAIAAKLLVTDPQRLLSVTLAAPNLIFEWVRQDREDNDRLIEAMEHEDKRVPFVLSLVPPDQPRPTPEQAAEIAKQALAGQDTQALAACLRGNAASLEVTEPQLKVSRLPVLVIYGNQDMFMSERIKQRLDRVAKILHGEVQVIAGGDHNTTPKMPAFLNAVTEFLRRHML